MKILVMGGSSFVSQVVAMHGIEAGHEVDIFTRGKTPIRYHGVHKHFIGDRRNQKDLKQLTEAYDVIMDVTPYHETDVAMLLEALDTTSLHRYVMCSTGSVYIDLEPGKIIHESHPRGLDSTYPNDYGYNKYLAEEYLLQHDVPVTIFRPTYIYGEYNDIYRDAYLFESIKKGTIDTLEDLCHIQFIYVKDLAKTFYSCLNNTKSINKAYNLAHEEKINWSSWIKAGELAVGQTVTINRMTDEEAFSQGQRFPFSNFDLFFDTTALKEDGLFVPNTTFEVGLKNAYAWYKTAGLSYVKKRRFDLEEDI